LRKCGHAIKAWEPPPGGLTPDPEEHPFLTQPDPHSP
jgi:hypothetical protein